MKVKNTKTNILAAAFLAIIATAVGFTAPTYALESTTTQTINIDIVDASLRVPNTGTNPADAITATASSSSVLNLPIIIGITLAAAAILTLFLSKTKPFKANAYKYKYGKRRFLPPILALGLCSALAYGVLSIAHAATAPNLTLDYDTLNYELAPGESAALDFTANITTDPDSLSYTLFAASDNNNSRISLHISNDTPSSSQIVPTHGTATPIIVQHSNFPTPGGNTENLNLEVKIADEAAIGDSYTIIMTYTVQTNEDEFFKFSIDTTFFDGGFLKDFSIPTNSLLGGFGSTHSYDWIINWGDGSPEQIARGTSRTDVDSRINHNYASTGGGEYQITIRPNGAPTNGWMNAFGFPIKNYADDYVQMFKSIDSPLTDMMRTKGASYRFANMFSNANNATGEIPANLFKNIDTSGDTDMSYMFYNTFNNYNHRTDSTIPAGLFDSIDTSSATNLSHMFDSTFLNYAPGSKTGTIPAGLFDSIDTSNATNLSAMFSQTFDHYASENRVTPKIPAGLLSNINLQNATNITEMFKRTFSGAGTPTSASTDINSIWNNANFAGKVTEDNAASVFESTFTALPSITGNAQTFINNKLGGINPVNRAYTFASTNVIDLSTLHANWK